MVGRVLSAIAAVDRAAGRLVEAVLEERRGWREFRDFWNGEARTYIGGLSNEEIDAQESARARGDG